MKKKLFFYAILNILNIQAEKYKIEHVVAKSSAVDSSLFEAISSAFPQDRLDEMKESFDVGLQTSENKIFFDAFLDDRVIGYVVCEAVSDRQVIIIKWALDKEFYDVAIIKDMLFAVLTKMNKTQVLRISSPAKNEELTMFFQDLGFFVVEKLSDENNLIFEFRGNSKCKLCDLLYGNIWQEDESDSDSDDESEIGIDVSASELVMSDIDYN